MPACSTALRQQQIVNTSKYSFIITGEGIDCLDCILPGVQVTTGLGFFLCSSHLCDNEDCDSLL